jgi:hypothetical protein
MVTNGSRESLECFRSGSRVGILERDRDSRTLVPTTIKYITIPIIILLFWLLGDWLIMFLKYHLQGYLRGRISSIGKCIYFLKKKSSRRVQRYKSRPPQFWKKWPRRGNRFWTCESPVKWVMNLGLLFATNLMV